MNDKKILDCIIIGGGPAALIGAVYISRALKSNVLITTLLGGQIIYSDSIENWPGEINISGIDLIEKMSNQLMNNGGKVEFAFVNKIKKVNDLIYVETDKETHIAKTALICTGARVKTLGLENEKSLFGKTLHTCALCDGCFYKDKVVAVIGGGNKGVEEAIYLSHTCEKVYLVHRRGELKAEKVLQRSLTARKNVELVLEETVSEIVEQESSKSKIDHLKLTSGRELKIDGMFLAIGTIPNSNIIEAEKTDDQYLKIDNNFETSIKNVFSAGEVSDNNYRQLTTSIGFATSAAINIIRRLDEISNIS